MLPKCSVSLVITAEKEMSDILVFLVPLPRLRPFFKIWTFPGFGGVPNIYPVIKNTKTTYTHTFRITQKNLLKKNRCFTNHQNPTLPALSAPSFPALAKAKESKTFSRFCSVELGGGAWGWSFWDRNTTKNWNFVVSLTNKVC